MAALGSLVVNLALQYAQYTQGLDRADQEALRFAQRAQQHFDTARGAAVDWAKGAAVGAVAAIASYETLTMAINGVREAIGRMDELDNLSQRLGITATKLQEISYVARLSDTDLQGAATGYKKLSIAMVEAAGGSDEAKKKFKAIGVEIKDANGNLRDSTEVMADVADYFENMEDGAAKTALAIDLFGKSGTDLIPMLNGGGKSMREAAEEARKFGVVVDDAAIKAAAAFGDSMDKITTVVEGTFNQVAAATTPVLASFAGAILDSMTATDSLNSAAQRLNKDGTIAEWATAAATGIAYVVDVAQVAFRILEMIGTTIGASAAQLVAVASGDFAGARRIGEMWKKDIGEIYDKELFSVKFKKRLEELKAEIASAENEVETKKNKGGGGVSDDTEKKISDAQKLINELKAKNAATAESLTLGRDLTEVEKMRGAIDAQVSAGTLKLTDTQREQVSALLDSIGANTALIDSRKAQEKADKELLDTEQKKLDAVNQAVEAAQRELDTMDMLPSQISRATAAKLEAHLATLKLTEGTESETEATRKQIAMVEAQIAAHNRLAGLQSSKEAADESKKAADQAAKDWQKAADKIEDALTNALMEGFESGKSFGESFRDTLVNMFKTMILRPVIQAIVQPIAGGMAGGGAGAGGGGTINSLASYANFAKNVYQGYQTGGITGAFGNAFGGMSSLGASLGNGVSAFGNMIGSANISAFGSGMGLTGAQASQAAAAYNGAGMTSTGSAISSGASWGAAANVVGMAYAGNMAGKALSNGFSAFGGSGNSAVNTGTAVGAAIGSIVPVIGTALGALVGGLLGGAVNRMFGHKPKEVTSFGINGTFSGDELSSGETYTNWKQKGGWFRSDKSGVEKGKIDGAMSDGLSDAFKLLKDASKGYADALGLDAAAVSSYSKTISLELSKDEAENQKRIADLFGTMADEIAVRLVPNIAEFKKEGETAAMTLERLTSTTKLVDGVMTAFGRTSTEAFGAAGIAAAAAKQRLVDLSGGVEAFAAQSEFFAANFLTDAERMAPLIKSVSDRMGELGQSSVKTKDQFAALVKGVDLSTQAGAELYANLMALAPAFLQVANYTAELEKVKDALPKPIAPVDGEEAPADDDGESLELLLKKRELEIDLMRAQGDEIGAVRAERELELASLHDSLKPIKERIYALQDEARAQAELKDSNAQAEAELARRRQILQAAVDNARANLSAAYDRESSALRGVIDQFGTFGKSIRAFRDSLLTGSLSTLSPEQKYQQTKADFDRTYSLAKAGDPAAMAALEGVSQKFLEASRDYYASSEQYGKDFAKVQAALTSAASAADTQAAIARRELAALDKSVEGLLTVNESVLSVRDAVLLLRGATAAAAGGGSAGRGLSASATDDERFVESLYSKYLDRASDSGGLDFYTDVLKRGAATRKEVEEAIRTSDEAKSIKKFAEGGVFTNGVVSQPTNFAFGQMGEAGPEAIVPLVRTPSGLGVRQVGGGDNAVLAAKLDRVITELEAANRQRGAVAGDQGARLDKLSDEMAAVQRQLARA